MKILLVCMKYDYGEPERGHSYEWNHFYLGLKPHFEEVAFFDFMSEWKRSGRLGMQQTLKEKILRTQPDVTIFSLYTDQFSLDFVDEIRGYTKTLCFFHDDGWRKDFVSQWAGHFDAFTTSDPNGIKKYLKRGWDHSVYLPFGVNESLFSAEPSLNKDIDVSFVGAWHPYREWLISRLIKAGVKVEVFGYRWPKGMLDSEQMVDLFRRSKISLNLSNCASWDIRYLASSPRAVLNRIRSPKVWEQIKGRHFEIPSCGSMQLSYYVEGLEKLFSIGDEIAIFNTPEELVEKVSFYLKYEDEREMMRQKGEGRVLADHTYGHRFKSVFKGLGWL